MNVIDRKLKQIQAVYRDRKIKLDKIQLDVALTVKALAAAEQELNDTKQALKQALHRLIERKNAATFDPVLHHAQFCEVETLFETQEVREKVVKQKELEHQEILKRLNAAHAEMKVAEKSQFKVENDILTLQQKKEWQELAFMNDQLTELAKKLPG